MEDELPRPTIWPATLAVGLVAACFGMITVGIFFYAGLILVVLAMVGWVRDLLGPEEPSIIPAPAPDELTGSPVPTADSAPQAPHA